MKTKFLVLAGVLIVADLFAGCASTGKLAEQKYYSQENEAYNKLLFLILYLYAYGEN
jgi:hypothetical protein